MRKEIKMGAYIFNGVPPGKYIEGGNPNSIRTFAVGGDKPLTCTSSSFVEEKFRVIDGTVADTSVVECVPPGNLFVVEVSGR
mmetsp:Transcript_2256/g.3533  ORF Transcript_2256/g.3533 Transcript_2256/m.3533 type:complete len:82 (+) Transcript_2256:316-561(+)